MHLYPSFGNYNCCALVLILKLFKDVRICNSGHCDLVHEPLNCFSRNISELVGEETGEETLGNAGTESRGEVSFLGFHFSIQPPRTPKVQAAFCKRGLEKPLSLPRLLLPGKGGTHSYLPHRRVVVDNVRKVLFNPLLKGSVRV